MGTRYEVRIRSPREAACGVADAVADNACDIFVRREGDTQDALVVTPWPRCDDVQASVETTVSVFATGHYEALDTAVASLRTGVVTT